MSHIVMCWEMGGGMGHIVPLSLLAAEMVRAGHRVSFVASDITHAPRYLAHLGVAWLPAPKLKQTVHLPPMNGHADILRNAGYGSVASLHAMLGGWRSLFGFMRPDRVVCEYAPTAQLAANSLGLPVVCIDNGFSIPPVGDPMPSFKVDGPVDVEAMRASERSVLQVVNGALEAVGARPVPRFSCLYEDETWYRNWPEFNHFGPHSPERHLGQIFGGAEGAEPRWPAGKGPRIFAYVKEDNPITIQLLQGAIALGFRVLAYLPGQKPAAIESLTASGRAIVSDRPVNLDRLDEDVDIGIWQSPTGGVGHSLDKGMRMLFLPTQAEQYLACKAVERSGVPAKVVVGVQNWKQVFDSLMAMPKMRLNKKWQPADLPRMARLLGGY